MEAHDRRALPEGWEIVNLPEIVFFQEGPGVRKHQFTTEGIKLINVGNLANNELVLDNTETYISIEEATTKYKHFLVDEGDLIIASSGIKVDYFHKKIAFAKRENLPLCMNTSTIRFKALNKNKISMKFFRYFIMTRFFTKQVQFHITGSAQLNFGPSHLEKMKVILPPLEIQNKIVSILEKAEETKRLRAQADELTDRLLQSVFLEMFGNPVKNPKGWKKVPFNKVCQTRLGKMLDKKKQTGHQCKPYLRNANVQWKKFDLSSVFEMDFNEAECAEFLLRKGDILICEGGEIGRTAIWNNELPECYFQKALHRARPFPDSAIPEFIVNLMLILGKCNGFRNFTSQSTIAHLTGVKLNLFPIILPPLPLQQKFARIVEKIEAMRQSQNQSKQQIEDLFSALMQKAFRGELER